MSRPTAAEIDIAALRHNFRIVASRLPEGTEVLAVVKADAYGHGAVPCATELAEAGVKAFGVATVEEGAELREGGIHGSVVVLGGVDGLQADEAHAFGLTVVLHDISQIGEFADVAADRERPFPVHVKIDTGMGRLGFLPSDLPEALEEIRLAGSLIRVDGWMTHLSSADLDDAASKEFTAHQLEIFDGTVAAARAAFGPGFAVHALNSAGIVSCPGRHDDLVRPGILLYGAFPGESCGRDLALRPVMRIVSRIASLKTLPAGHPVSYGRRFSADSPRDIAVVPIGYADGYRRAFSGVAEMTVLGRRAPVVGSVCMDHTMIDVTGIPGVAVGTDVVVMGDPWNTADELAKATGTIPYEILTQVGRRIPRRILD